MKKIILVILFLNIVTGCSLEQKNQNEISGDNIINNKQKAYNLLSYAYMQLPIDPEIFTVLSEDLQPSYLINYNSDIKAFYAWQEVNIKNNTKELWKNYYESILHINVILQSEESIVDKDIEWNYIKGNALVLKAYIYFDLLQLYSQRYSPNNLGIIAKDNISVENNKRLSQGESIDLIKTLIDQGIDLMEDYTDQKNYFINIPAAKNLKAQVLLYTKEYNDAEKIAKNLITSFPKLPSTKSEYASIWNTPLESKISEVFWIYNYQKNPNHYLLESAQKGDLFYINHFIPFSNEDIRYEISQYYFNMKTLNGKDKDQSLLGKYKTKITDYSERNIVLSRNTETYFILIESLIEQNKLSEATDYLNNFLKSINNSTIDQGKSQKNLRLLMQAEKQKEFIGEKINYFDLKRWDLSIARYLPDSNNRLTTISNTDYRWTWPIPDEELRYNNNAIQNDGWPTLNSN